MKKNGRLMPTVLFAFWQQTNYSIEGLYFISGFIYNRYILNIVRKVPMLLSITYRGRDASDLGYLLFLSLIGRRQIWPFGKMSFSPAKYHVLS